MHRTHHALALAFALTVPLTAACGKGSQRPPGERAAPATTGGGAGTAATPPAPPPIAPTAATPAAPPTAQTAPILDDAGLVGLTPAQMTSAAALQAAFPTAKVITASRRYCPPGTSQTSPTECGATEGGDRAGAPAAGPVRTYQVLTVQGSVPRAVAASYLLQVIADGDRPVNISYDVGRLAAADLGPMPTTLAAAQRWRPQSTCTWEQYPEASAHLMCRYRDSKLRVVTQGPTPRVDQDSESANVDWDVEPAELPTWIAGHGSDPVTSVEWGDELGPQAN